MSGSERQADGESGGRPLGKRRRARRAAAIAALAALALSGALVVVSWGDIVRRYHVWRFERAGAARRLEMAPDLVACGLSDVVEAWHIDRVLGDDRRDAAAAIESLRELDSHRAVPAFVELLAREREAGAARPMVVGNLGPVAPITLYPGSDTDDAPNLIARLHEAIRTLDEAVVLEGMGAALLDPRPMIRQIALEQTSELELQVGAVPRVVEGALLAADAALLAGSADGLLFVRLPNTETMLHDPLPADPEPRSVALATILIARHGRGRLDFLIDRLERESGAARVALRRAIAGMGVLAPEEVLPRLTRLLRESKSACALDAVTAIAYMTLAPLASMALDAEIAAALAAIDAVPRAGGTALELRARLVRALLASDDASASALPAILEQAMRDDDGMLRFVAAAHALALGGGAGDAGIAGLEALMREDGLRWLPRNIVIQQVLRSGDAGIERLIALAETEADPALRRRAIDLLGELGSQGRVAADRLAALARRTSDVEERRAIEQALSRIGKPRSGEGEGSGSPFRRFLDNF